MTLKMIDEEEKTLLCSLLDITGKKLKLEFASNSVTTHFPRVGTIQF